MESRLDQKQRNSRDELSQQVSRDHHVPARPLRCAATVLVPDVD